MSATHTMTENRTSLHAAVASTAARLAPGYGPPRPRHLSLLATASAPPVPSAWTDTTAKVVTVLLAARARHDTLEDGADLIRRSFDGVRLIRPASLSDGVRSHLYASAGEYCNAIGWALMGARFGAEALLFAETDASRYRALTVSALGHALNGEYETARAVVTEATDLFAACGWDVSDTAYAVLLADALIAKAHLQIDRLGAVAATMRAAQPDDPSWDYSARAIDVMAQILRQDFEGALAASDPLVAPDGPRPGHRLMRDLLLCWRSDVLIAQGEYTRALSALAPYENSEGHGICFSGKRSAGLLHLGRERELLDETEACVASEADHSLRTLIPVLLQRALAHHRLGARERARASTEAAMILLLRTGTSATPFIMLPHAETRDLIAALHAERPEFSEAMPCVFDALALVAHPDEQGASPRVRGRLTRTELELVDRLARADAIAEIARDREVSVNTVKSQLRSIYAKLGVRGRAEAVEVLTRAPDAPSACGRTADE